MTPRECPFKVGDTVTHPDWHGATAKVIAHRIDLERERVYVQTDRRFSVQVKGRWLELDTWSTLNLTHADPLRFC